MSTETRSVSEPSRCLLTPDLLLTESVQEAKGPLLVEVGRRGGNDLGISLGQRQNEGKSYTIIEEINIASIAERFASLTYRQLVPSWMIFRFLI